MKAVNLFRKVNRSAVRARRTKRALIYIAVFIALIIVYTVAYKHGMAAFEGEHRSYIRSFQTVVESMTTTGYGEDAPWHSVQMNLFMVMIQFTGILAIFLTLPLFVVPWMEEALKSGVPRTAPDMSDHVVICGTDTTARVLVDECTARSIPYLIIEPDREEAARLNREGYRVMTGDPESTDTLSEASVEDARVVVTDSSDEATASIVLAARDLAPGVSIVSLVEDPQLTRYLQYAGADAVLSPRYLLGLSLADKVATTVTAEVGGQVTLGEDLNVVELPVQRSSPAAGKTLQESGLWEEAGTAIIGAWLRGEFVTAPGPDTFIDEQSVLLVAGSAEQLEQLRDRTLGAARSPDHGDVVIAGYGEVGSTVGQALDGDVDMTVIDTVPHEGVDVVGDAADEGILKDAGVEDADAVIVAVADDTAAVFITLVARKLNPDVEIVVRANESGNINKLYRAGADYVLSLETVSGRMVARNILGEEILSPGTQVKLVRTTAPKLAGSNVSAAKIGEKTGTTVVAIERDGTIITDIGPTIALREGDEVILAGRDGDIARFEDRYG